LSQTPFRSIQQRVSQSEGISDRKAPDRSKQTAELARQQNIQNQNLQTVIGLNQNFASLNQQTISEIDINNQRLVQTQLSNNRELSLKARELRQRQGLADEKMLADFDNQINNLRNAQQITADQIKQQQNIARDSAITNLGESFLKFSGTLVEQRAEAVNQANRQIMAGAMLDGLLSGLNTDTSQVDQAQDARVEANLALSDAADTDEREGRINDATELRSNNGFYAYGYAEGIALKAAGSFTAFLKQEQEAFEKTVPFGTPDAYIKHQSHLRKATEKFIDQNNLASIPPQILNKYFARTALSAQAQVASEYNAKNAKYVKNVQVETAVAQVRTAGMPYQQGAVFNRDQYANDLTKQLLTLYAADPTNATVNFKKAFDSLAADAKLGRNLAPVAVFIEVVDNDDFFRQFGNEAFEAYPAFVDQQEQKTREERNRVSAENLANLQLQTQQLDDITDIDTRSQILEQIEQQGRAAGLTAADQVKLGNTLNNTSVVNTRAAKQTTERWLSEMPRTAEEVRQYAENNRTDMGTDAYEELQQIADRYDKRESTDPNTTARFKQAKESIASLVPTIGQNEFQADATLRDRVNQAVENRQLELQKRYNQWVRSDSSMTFDKFLQQNEFLLKNPITQSEYKPGQVNTPQQPKPGVKLEAVPNNPGKKARIYSRAAERQIARAGGYGTLEPEDNVYLEPRELLDQVTQYEDNVITPLLKDLARAAGVSPGDFLRAQAKLMNIPGTVEDPKPESFTSTKRGFQPIYDTSTFFMNKGLRGNAADALAQVVMSASAGNSGMAGTQRGLFDFNDAEQTKLYDFASSSKRDPIDPYTQLEYVYAKILSLRSGSATQKAHYARLTSSKPTTDQLRNALKALFPGMDSVLIDRAISNIRSN